MAVTILHAPKAQHLAAMREAYRNKKGVDLAQLCAKIQELIDSGTFSQSDLASVFGAGRAASVRANIQRVANAHAALASEVGE